MGNDSSYGRIGSDGNIYLNAGLSPQSAEKTLAAQMLTAQLQSFGDYDGLIDFIESYAPGKSWLEAKSRDLLEWHMIDEPLQSFSDYADYIQQRNARHGREVSRENALQEAAADWCAENLLGRKVDGEPDASGRNYDTVKALVAHDADAAGQIETLLQGMMGSQNNAFAQNYARVSGNHRFDDSSANAYGWGSGSDEICAGWSGLTQAELLARNAADDEEARKFLCADARDNLQTIVRNSTIRLENGFACFPKGDPLQQYVQKVKPLAGYFDVGMHGSPSAVGFGTEKANMSPRLLAAVIRHSEGWNGQKIRLLSCSTGKQIGDAYCFAEELANALGAEVLAPNDLLYIYSSGKMHVGEYSSGRFVRFFPNQRGRKK